MSFHKKYAIIFDWDGVIVNTAELYAGIYRDICNKYNKVFPPGNLEEFRDWYDSEWENNLYSLGFSSDAIPVISDYISKTADYDNVHFFPGIQEILLELNNYYNLAIASTTLSAKIRKRLETEKMDHIFSIISGGDDGKSEKITKIQKVIDYFNISPHNCIMIGDTTMDIISARELDIRAIGLTCGLNSRKKLEKTSPSFILDSHKELFTSIESIFPVK